jgi:hypothetical protein
MGGRVKRFGLASVVVLALCLPAVALGQASQQFHSGWFELGEIATSGARTAWHEVSFCCKNKNKNTTYALVRGFDGEWYCGGASIAVSGGCSYWQESHAPYGYVRNTGSEGYSLTSTVYDWTT